MKLSSCCACYRMGELKLELKAVRTQAEADAKAKASGVKVDLV